MTAFADVIPGVADQILAGVGASPTPALGEFRDLTKAETPETDVDRVVDGLDLAGLAATRDALEGLIVQAATAGALSGKSTLRVMVPGAEDFALPSDSIQAWARDRAASLVGKRVLDDGTVVDNPRSEYAITEATREMLRGVVSDAFEGPMTRDEMIARLQDEFAFSPSRAETIARTEISQALIQGNLESWKASGVVDGKEWVLGSEHDVDDECDDAAAAGVIPIDATFPGGFDGPPAHPRCVCDVLPVVSES